MKKFTTITLCLFVVSLIAFIADRYVSSRFLTIGVSISFFITTCFGLLAWLKKEGRVAMILFFLNLICFIATSALLLLLLSISF